MLQVDTSQTKAMHLPQRLEASYITHALSRVAATYAAAIMRALVLLLVALLLVLIGVMFMTQQFGAGALVIGGILLTGIGASQFDRTH